MSYLLLTALLALSQHNAPSVKHVPLPTDSQVADTVVRPDGKVWVAYGRKGDVYFQTFSIEGGWSGDEVRVSSAKRSALIGGERGPCMTVGKDDVIHIIWTGRKEHGIAYTRSLDRGKTWEPQRNLLEPKIDAEGPTIMADADGNVVAAWLDGRLGETKESPVSYTLVVRRSSDNGKSFSTPAPVSEAAQDRACMCCELSSIVSADGSFGIAHRKAFNNLRDMTFWSWEPGGDWRRNDVSDDGWKFAGCPMTGAGLSYSPSGGDLAVAWMSKGIVYLSSSNAYGEFAARKSVSNPKGKARHVGLAVAGDGRRLVSWYDEKAVHWNLLDAKRVSISHGSLPHTGLSKAEPVAVGEGFYIFY